MLRSLDEQLDRLESSQLIGPVVIAWKLERRDPEGDLAGMPERLATGRHDDQIGASRQQLRSQRDDRVEDVLAVVDDEQDRAVRELVDERGDPRPVALERQLEGATDRGRDVVAVRHAGQLHEPHPVGPAGTRQLAMRELDGQAGLAGPAGSGQREQPRTVEQSAELTQFPMATHEARRQGGEVVQARPRIGSATDEEPAVDGGGLRRRGDTQGFRKTLPKALERSRGVAASPGRGQGDQQRREHVLVERALHHQRLEQRKGLLGLPDVDQEAGEIAHQPASRPLSRSRCGAAQSS